MADQPDTRPQEEPELRQPELGVTVVQGMLDDEDEDTVHVSFSVMAPFFESETIDIHLPPCRG